MVYNNLLTLRTIDEQTSNGNDVMDHYTVFYDVGEVPSNIFYSNTDCTSAKYLHLVQRGEVNNIHHSLVTNFCVTKSSSLQSNSVVVVYSIYDARFTNHGLAGTKILVGHSCERFGQPTDSASRRLMIAYEIQR